jgi:hypothetical protein
MSRARYNAPGFHLNPISLPRIHSMFRIAFLVLTAGVAVSVATSAQALDMPKRKSGLWELKTTTSNSSTPRTMQMCVDEQTDDILQNFGAGMGKKTCSKNDLRKEGNQYIGESVCSFGGSTATSRSVFTGDFTTDYRGETKSTYNPPMMGMSEASTLIEAKWTGPCKPGQKAGDVIMADMPAGMPSINLKDLHKMFKE